MKMYFQR